MIPLHLRLRTSRQAFAGHTAVPPTGPPASPTVAVAVGTTLSARQGGTPQE
ncbi:hypothetical protein [Streptomyces kasugaensis]|uniref:hypothetical protein n=1 Tax=Streptomyces kasugaensis TaxID=1946 RepID=UPI0013EF89F5|nr:hypothetical protein [Streptomyces kasugaensis]